MKINCPRCGLSHDSEVTTCDCGYDLKLIKKEINKNKGDHYLRKYEKIFRAVSIIYSAILIIAIIISIINNGLTDIFNDLLTYIISIISILSLWGVAETIDLVISKSNEIDNLNIRIREIAKEINRDS